MTKVISISTKKGDNGESFLASGKKLAKDELVFEVLGNLDELNSQLGLVVAQLRVTVLSGKEVIIEDLEAVQANLYQLSGVIAQAPKSSFSKTKLTKLEKLAETLFNKMADGWTTKFLYPGGSVIGAHLDIARSVCRRCERSLVAYSKQEKLKPVILQYLNRLSDFLFILRCDLNIKLGVKEKQFGS